MHSWAGFWCLATFSARTSSACSSNSMLSWCVSLVCALVSFRFSGMEYFVVCLAFVSIYTQKFPAVNLMVSSGGDYHLSRPREMNPAIIMVITHQSLYFKQPPFLKNSVKDESFCGSHIPCISQTDSHSWRT